MECTGNYHLPIANALHAAGLHVSTVHALLIYDFGNNSIRKRKNDKADAVKIANYGLANWLELPRYVPEENVRQMLKAFSRQYNKYSKVKTTLKNNLTSLLDQSFPNPKVLFTSPAREKDGHEKWLDFAASFWHAECVASLSEKAFSERYQKWNKRNGYHFSKSKAAEIHAASRAVQSVMPRNDSSKLLVTQAVAQINAVAESLAVVARETKRLAALLPEYPVVMEFFGVGEILGSQIIAEVGDVYRYAKKSSLVSFAGLEPVENQSGKRRGQEEISKQGSPHLRKALFQVMDLPA
jgi:transposase